MTGVKGRSGRKPKPDKLKKLSGSRQPLNGDVEAKPGEPKRPSWLTKEAARYWDEVIGYISEIPELLATVDGPAVAEFCQAIHIATTETDPRLVNKSRENVRHWISKFGMSPQDRTGIKIPPKETKTEDPFAKFLKRSQGDN